MEPNLNNKKSSIEKLEQELYSVKPENNTPKDRKLTEKNYNIQNSWDDGAENLNEVLDNLEKVTTFKAHLDPHISQMHSEAFNLA
jgi:hypothetical protein